MGSNKCRKDIIPKPVIYCRLGLRAGGGWVRQKETYLVNFETHVHSGPAVKGYLFAVIKQVFPGYLDARRRKQAGVWAREKCGCSSEAGRLGLLAGIHRKTYARDREA